METDDAALPSDGERPETTRPERPAPILPPRAAPPTEVTAEVWEQLAAQLEHETSPTSRAARRALRRRWLVPTRGAAMIATAGWAGAVVAQLLLLSALVPSFDLGRTRDFLVPLDESAWFGGTFVVSAAAAGLGWLAWTVAAAFNVRRVSPLSTSPLLPVAVYVLGPIVVLLGMASDGPERLPMFVGGLVWCGLGHLTVIGSFRNAASRIGAQADEFTKLVFLPMAGVTYRVFVNVVVSMLPDDWRTTPVLFGLGAVGGLFVCGMVASTWRATTSFDEACHRLNTRSLGVELPPVERVSAAWRRTHQP
ncbi:MAG: hypothetical protein U0Q03_11760 [Acidimicrobiales bacterium]